LEGPPASNATNEEVECFLFERANMFDSKYKYSELLALTPTLFDSPWGLGPHEELESYTRRYDLYAPLATGDIKLKSSVSKFDKTSLRYKIDTREMNSNPYSVGTDFLNPKSGSRLVHWFHMMYVFDSLFGGVHAYYKPEVGVAIGSPDFDFWVNANIRKNAVLRFDDSLAPGSVLYKVIPRLKHTLGGRIAYAILLDQERKIGGKAFPVYESIKHQSTGTKDEIRFVPTPHGTIPDPVSLDSGVQFVWEFSPFVNDSSVFANLASCVHLYLSQIGLPSTVFVSVTPTGVEDLDPYPSGGRYEPKYLPRNPWAVPAVERLVYRMCMDPKALKPFKSLRAIDVVLPSTSSKYASGFKHNQDGSLVNPDLTSVDQKRRPIWDVAVNTPPVEGLFARTSNVAGVSPTTRPLYGAIPALRAYTRFLSELRMSFYDFSELDSSHKADMLKAIDTMACLPMTPDGRRWAANLSALHLVFWLRAPLSISLREFSDKIVEQRPIDHVVRESIGPEVARVFTTVESRVRTLSTTLGFYGNLTNSLAFGKASGLKKISVNKILGAEPVPNITSGTKAAYALSNPELLIGAANMRYHSAVGGGRHPEEIEGAPFVELGGRKVPVVSAALRETPARRGRPIQPKVTSPMAAPASIAVGGMGNLPEYGHSKSSGSYLLDGASVAGATAVPPNNTTPPDYCNLSSDFDSFDTGYQPQDGESADKGIATALAIITKSIIPGPNGKPIPWSQVASIVATSTANVPAATLQILPNGNRSNIPLVTTLALASGESFTSFKGSLVTLKYSQASLGEIIQLMDQPIIPVCIMAMGDDLYLFIHFDAGSSIHRGTPFQIILESVLAKFVIQYIAPITGMRDVMSRRFGQEANPAKGGISPYFAEFLKIAAQFGKLYVNFVSTFKITNERGSIDDFFSRQEVMSDAFKVAMTRGYDSEVARFVMIADHVAGSAQVIFPSDVPDWAENAHQLPENAPNKIRVEVPGHWQAYFGAPFACIVDYSTLYDKRFQFHKSDVLAELKPEAVGLPLMHYNLFKRKKPDIIHSASRAIDRMMDRDPRHVEILLGQQLSVLQAARKGTSRISVGVLRFNDKRAGKWTKRNPPATLKVFVGRERTFRVFLPLVSLGFRGMGSIESNVSTYYTSCIDQAMIAAITGCGLRTSSKALGQLQMVVSKAASDNVEVPELATNLASIVISDIPLSSLDDALQAAGLTNADHRAAITDLEPFRNELRRIGWDAKPALPFITDLDYGPTIKAHHFLNRQPTAVPAVTLLAAYTASLVCQRVTYILT
jgi:hypothetical protein